MNKIELNPCLDDIFRKQLKDEIFEIEQFEIDRFAISKLDFDIKCVRINMNNCEKINKDDKNAKS